MTQNWYVKFMIASSDNDSKGMKAFYNLIMSSIGFHKGASKPETMREQIFSEHVKKRMELLGMTVPQRLTSKRLKLHKEEIEQAEENYKRLESRFNVLFDPEEPETFEEKKEMTL